MPQVVQSLQELVDALSAELERPVLLDDAALRPLAYSRQWGRIDNVRTESILSRGASPEVRRALFAQGIATARGAVRTGRVPRLGMEERVCVPVRHRGVVHGYLWLLDDGVRLDADDVARAEMIAARAAEIVASEASARSWLRDERELVARVLAGGPEALAAVRDRRLLREPGFIVAILQPPGGRTEAALARLGRRLSAGHALAGTEDGRVVLLASLGEPVLSVLHPDEIASRLLAVLEDDDEPLDVAVGQSAAQRALEAAPTAYRQATIALRVASAQGAGGRHAVWNMLGPDRLVAQLPAEALADVPGELLELVREDSVLAATLAAFLDSGGNVKATSAALNLHRSGVYYRLARIEELTGLDLDRGDDRLLAQLALRLARLG